MNDDDLNKLSSLIDGRLAAQTIDIKTELKAQEKRFDQKLSDQEKRLNQRLDVQEKRFDQKLSDQEERIIEETGRFIEQNLLPQIEEKAGKSDIDRLERKLDNYFSKIPEYDKRLKDIESSPVIAHALRTRKSS